MQSDLDRFLTLVCRELGAEEVRLLDEAETPPEDPGELSCRMSDGRSLRVRFALPPGDRESKQRRLEMLMSSFDAVVESERPPRRSSRPPVVRALHDELESLRVRAGAVNTIVIDANSPVQWAAARPPEAIPLEPRGSAPPADPTDGDENRGSESSVMVISRRAVQTVRALPEVAAIRKGRHLRHVDRMGDPPAVAHSFAGIYVLLVVFDAPFDELRAERAILEALPRVERLVLALPPLDPVPLAGVASIRRARRR